MISQNSSVLKAVHVIQSDLIYTEPAKEEHNGPEVGASCSSVVMTYQHQEF